jgi:hypothetical protein
LQLFLLRLRGQLRVRPVFATLTRELLDLRATVLGSSTAPFALVEDCCSSTCCCSGWCVDGC